MIPRTNLTDRERQVLDFIEAHVARTGVTPDRRAISDHMGWAATNGYCLRVLDGLEAHGFITRRADGAIVLNACESLAA